MSVSIPPTTTLGTGFASVEVVNTDTGFKTSNAAFALLQGDPAAGIPSITSIDGVGLAATSSDPSYATNNVQTVVVQGSKVTIGGMGFETGANGVAVDIFCACTGGKVGPSSSVRPAALRSLSPSPPRASQCRPTRVRACSW